MVASELSNRLECLTRFDSQLVFVCSDKIKQQSFIVESFISQQNEQTNIALITANELLPLASYRETVFKQLIDNQSDANYNLPLIQLLAQLNLHDGPVLISVFNADQLPPKLIKEIWELVLQSRFARNKQHLNVLLMGQSSWAESCKNALGAKSKEKPILLTGSSLAVNAPASPSSMPPYANPLTSHGVKPKRRLWPIALSTVLFLVTFTGLLGWLYKSELFEYFSYKEPTSVPQIGQAANNKTPSKEQSAVLSVASTDTLLRPKKTEPYSNENTVIPAVTTLDAKQQQAVYSLRQSSKELGTELMVTDWPSAKEKSTQINQKRTTTNSKISAAITELVSTPKEQNATLLTSDIAPQTSNLEDYQVSDTTSESVETPPSAIVSEKPIALSNNATISDSTEELVGLSNSAYVIQIAALSDIDLLQEYAADKALQGRVWLYTTKRFGGQWHVLLVNKSYSSLQQARNAILELPESMQNYVPFVKKVSQVQQEIEALAI